MSRIRTVKPGLFKNETLAELPAMSRLLFIGLFCLADREGRLEDRPKRIKAELLPYDNADVNDLLSRLQSAGFINRYEVGELKVIQVVNFTKHQRITGSEATTESELPECTGDHSGNTLETLEKHLGRQEGKGMEGISVSNETLGDKSPDSLKNEEKNSPKELQKSYKTIPKDKKCIHEFIRDNRPTFSDPYIDFWNLFAKQFKIPEVKIVTEQRSRKLKIRLAEPEFDFSKIIRKANQAGDFLLTSKWFSFDWIIQNQENYLKLLEGNYDKKESGKPLAGATSLADEIRNKRLQNEIQN